MIILRLNLMNLNFCISIVSIKDFFHSMIKRSTLY